MSITPPSILDIHTPSTSFSIVHSLTQESLSDLFSKLSRKSGTGYFAEQVGIGWLKYEHNDSIWNLDDDSDYAIFAWRQQEDDQALHDSSMELSVETIASSSKSIQTTRSGHSMQPPHIKAPTLHLHDPKKSLPSPPEYCNSSYYVFRPHAQHAVVRSRRSVRSPVPSSKSKKGKVVGLGDDSSEDDGVPKFKKQFNRFHEENGVRTVTGSIGSAQNVRMLLKPSYRHVYMSRQFAIKHSFIPIDAGPGNYGYGGLITIGKWPITLVPSASQPLKPSTSNSSSVTTQNSVSQQLAASRIPPMSSALGSPNTSGTGTGARGVRRARQSVQPESDQTARKEVVMDVYLSEEPHFDVVLGRSFFEKRQIKLSTIDPTDVVCLDTGEKIECELVILKDGRGEIITVT